MSPFPTFPVLFLVLLIAGTSTARASTEELKSDDLKSYWKTNTNNQPLPEALQDLFPSGELEKDLNMVHSDNLRYKSGHSGMVHPDYLRYKNDPNMVRPDYLGYKNDPNMMHPDYLRYKNDPNIDGPNYLRNKNNANMARLDYLGYKNDPNMVHTNYLGYEGDSPLNNDVDPEGAVTLQSDPTGVNLDYLGYKNDPNLRPDYLRYRSDSNMVRPDYLRYKNDPNMVRPNYLRYKNDPNMLRPDYLRYKNDPNMLRPDYLRYKNDQAVVYPDYLRYKNDPDMVRPDYLPYKKSPNMVNPDYLRYKNDENVVHPNYLLYRNVPNLVNPDYLRYKNGRNIDYLRYKNDPNMVNLDYLRYKKHPIMMRLNYLRYKKDSPSNNANHEVSVTLKKDPKRVNFDYLRYKKDSLSAKVEYGKLLVFTPSDLQVGKKFLTVFPHVHSSSGSQFASPKFMPRHVADSIPFSLVSLPDIMQRFGIKQDSLWAKSVEETLKSCEGEETMGETLFCATSLESMLDSVRKTIGPNYEINVISTTHLTKPSKDNGPIETPQKYTLLEAPKEIEAPKKLNCHPMTYLYPVFGCHSVKDTKIYRLSLEGEDKSKVDAVAVCHMDTSDWSADALFLLAAGLKPGDGAVCHFMQPSHFSIYASTKGA